VCRSEPSVHPAPDKQEPGQDGEAGTHFLLLILSSQFVPVLHHLFDVCFHVFFILFVCKHLKAPFFRNICKDMIPSALYVASFCFRNLKTYFFFCCMKCFFSHKLGTCTQKAVFHSRQNVDIYD